MMCAYNLVALKHIQQQIAKEKWVRGTEYNYNTVNYWNDQIESCPSLIF